MCVGLLNNLSYPIIIQSIHVSYDLKLVGRYTSLNQNIYVAIDPRLSKLTLLRLPAFVLGALNVYSANHNDPPTLFPPSVSSQRARPVGLSASATPTTQY